MAPLADLSFGLIELRLGNPRIMLLTAIVAAVAWMSVSLILRRREKTGGRFVPSPGKTLLPELQEQEAEDLPYPLDALPGGRDVITPYGSIRVYEWGPEGGERVLFVHGISTPVVSLGDLGHEFANKGYRVMLFGNLRSPRSSKPKDQHQKGDLLTDSVIDLFGRGYSDAPNDLDYDARLYVTQILLVLASSKLPWTTFHLIGYSLGGCLSVSFTRYFPHLVRSLTLVASGGLIRPYHVGWQSRLLYSSGLIPEFLVKMLVRKRIRPKHEQPHSTASGADIMSAETTKRLPNGDGDSNGGDGFDSAAISKFRPDITVASVVRWQVDHHKGFVTAFLSTIRNAPIYAPQDDWKNLAMVLETRRRLEHGNKPGSVKGMHAGKILMVLGDDDPVIVKDEVIEDAEQVLGLEGVEFAILPGGHEIPFTMSSGIANAIDGFWHKFQDKLVES
ncbi:alpha/beta-hydrolase [Annulohypoxylon maeteangense]|uniref:alpha/beta-hydrolase n=1 Tax=Annulohypoxylon maeteangense TaxID=1927788 RepID=UPI00200887A0|nr:alpha/beta-hydrolase [Annulohypoxylon maeteangense]KAI0889757.1 alpha/beta-hydrolase [Annulohypoxylon maeteangense]